MKVGITHIRYYIDLIGTFVEGYDYPRFAADLRTSIPSREPPTTDSP